MKKQYRTRQYFKFQHYNSYGGVWEIASYSLLSSDVTEFYHYIDNLDYTYEKAFERIANKVILDLEGNANYRDIVLIIETHKL